MPGGRVKTKEGWLSKSDYQKLTPAQKEARKHKYSKNAHIKVNKEGNVVPRKEKGKNKPKTKLQREKERDVLMYSRDFRNSSKTVTESNEVFMPNSNPSMVYDVPTTLNAITAPAIAIISYALQRGWAPTTVNPSYPYYATIYLSQYFINSANSSVVNVMVAIKAARDIAQALETTTVPMENGLASYKFALQASDASVLSYLRGMGPQQYLRNWNVGVPAVSSNEQSTDYVDINPPAAYNAQLGADAYAHLMNFLHKAGGEDKNGQIMAVSPIEKSRYNNVASAFSYGQVTGGGFAGCGSPASTLKLEVPITDPVLGVFVPYNSNTVGEQIARYGCFTRAWQGDGLTAAGILMNKVKPNQASFKKPPVYKFIDFNEVAEIVFLWVESVQRQIAKDPEVLEAIRNNPGNNYQDKITCQLSQDEILYILRATLMNLFKSTQYFTQSLYPRYPVSSQDNQFVAFVSGIGTFPQPATTEMRLPTILIENLRCLTERVNYGDKGGKKNPRFIFPVLGQYYSDVFSPNGNSVPIIVGTDTDVTVQSFKPKAVGDPTISMIDGASGSTYKVINDPSVLNKLIILWNDWINDWSMFMTDLTTIGTDGGISTLCMLPTTTHWVKAGVEKVRKETPLDARIRKRMGGIPSASPYYNRKIIAITSQGPLMQHPWETIQQLWINPINLSDAETEDPQSFTFYTRSAAFLKEPQNLVIENTNKVYSLYVKHLELANMCTRSKLAPPSSIDLFLREEEKKGRGGILSSLGASLASAFGAPPALSSAISLIPF